MACGPWLAAISYWSRFVKNSIFTRIRHFSVAQKSHYRQKFIHNGASKSHQNNQSTPTVKIKLCQLQNIKIKLGNIFRSEIVDQTVNLVFFTSALFPLRSVVLQLKVVTEGLSLLLDLVHLHPRCPCPSHHHRTCPRLCHSAPPSLSSKEVNIDRKLTSYYTLNT